jgi:ABC-type sugar transport system ATPase subunit
MSGRESVEDLEAAAEHASDAGAGEGGLAHGAVLRVEDLVLRHGASPISLELRRGEILGVAGLEGQGQVEFVECLCALRRATSGRVLSIDNEGHGAAIHSYADANRHGIRYVPRDRRHEGMFAPLSVFDNFAMALWSKLNVFGVLKRNEAKRRYREYSDASHLVAGSKGRSVSTLSGGNQQKILLGRWVAMNPRTLVLNDPLRGVDVRTREDLYQYFRSLASNGIAIVFLSTEIIELLRLTERIAVFHEGHLHALLESKKATDTNVVAAMFGRDPEHHADA